MNFFLALFLAAIVVIFVVGITFIASWFIVSSIYLPLINDGLSNSVLTYAILEFLGDILSGFFLIPSSLFIAASDIFTNVRENIIIITVLALVSTAAFVWLEYHPQIIKAGLEARQCGIRPIVDGLINPILNLVRIVYDVVIQVVNFWASVMGYLIYGGPVILFKCAASALSIAQLMNYVAIFLQTLFQDFSAWITDQPLFNDFNIENGIEAFANIFIAALPVLDCFCKGLHFLWVWLETLIGLQSLSSAINFAWITFINFLQIPFFVIQNPTHQPDFTNVTLHSCATVIAAGEFIEEAVFLTSETLYGLITNMTDLPPSVAAALSIRYTYVITHPLCGFFRIVNMTVVAAINFEAIVAPNGTGVAYFQFGVPLDELKVAAFVIGDLFDIIDDEAQSLVNSTLFAIIDVIAFLFEWILGNIFYFSFGGPLPASFGLFGQPTPTSGPANFWRYYFVDYWFKAIPFGTPVQNPFTNTTITFPVTIGNYTYASALDSFFQNVFRATQSLGDLIGLFNVPLGQTVRHLVNIVAAFFLFLANQISYSFCAITFTCDNMPITERNVNVDLFFNETYFFAGAAGDLFRQFDNASCANLTEDANKTILCLTGEIVETSIDVIALALQQVIHFVQDLLTLPTGQIKSCLFETVNVSRANCLRIPDLTTAITELDDALCAFGYAVTALVPFSPALACPFAPESNVTRTCTRVQTCLGFEFCSILRFVPIILQIINSLFIKIVSGTSFSSFEQFLTFSVGLLVNQFGVVLEQFALFLDCSICAAEGAPIGGCSSPIFDVIHPIADALRDLAKIFTSVFLKFVQMVILLVVGLFSGNPVTALIDFIFAFAQNILLGIGFALVDFIAKLLDKIGLGFLGTFIKILYSGFCTVLEVIINAIIVVLKIITFNRFPHDYVQFCCSDGGCIPHVGTKKRLDEPITLGNIKMVNMDNWLGEVVDGVQIWEAQDACNASMTLYKSVPFTSMTTPQFGEVLFCGAKLIWHHRSDNQSTILPFTCDRMIMENMNRSFDSFNILEQGSIMECAFYRLLVEGFRHRLNISWLPQDLMTNPLRSLYFGFGLTHGLLLNAQFFNDKSLPPSVILGAKYQQFWRDMHVSTDLYEGLQTVDDVVRFREHLSMRTYFDTNNASQYDATLYIATGVWSLAGTLMKGLANMTTAFSDNITDAGVYLSYNYSQDSAPHASVSAFWSILSDTFSVLTNMTTFWSDPANYKKRSEAYNTLTTGSLTMYKAAVRQLQLMASEYQQTKVYEATHYYNQTCATEQECRDRGVTQFREAYEASMRGEDTDKGATSLVYKFSTWWSKADFTVYPIRNPRYKDHRIKEPQPLYYHDEQGVLQSETHWQRFWRHAALARRGTPAAQRRWQVATALYERTKDKFYTRVLRRVYRNEYIETNHHMIMKSRYEKEGGQAVAWRRMHPHGERVCDWHRTSSSSNRGGRCVMSYDMSDLEYDQNRYSVKNAINETAIQVLNPIHIAGNDDFSAMVFSASQFLETPCINDISFPCSYPLECDGNTTTNLCVQCLYLQAFIDRIIAATDQLITYYEPGGRFNQSLTEAFHYFNYSIDPNAVVVVGDSPSLQVNLFPAVGDGFIDFIVQSMRYMGDNTPNKLRFNDIVNQANMIIGNTSGGGGGDTNITNSTLFTRVYHDTINGQVFDVISVLFAPLLNFFYNVYLFIVGSQDQESAIIAYFGEMFIFCDWLVGDDFSGVNKRFSIGETVVLFAAIIIVASLLSIALFGFDIVALLFTASITMTILGSVFLTIYANWSYLCSPGLPVILANDLLYFWTYNFFPKCSWLWGFMMNSAYTNANCYSCNATKALELTHCVHNEGFFDFTYNIAFVLDVFFPQFVNYLRTSTGFARLFVLIPPVNARLNYFSGLDLTDPFLWARYQGCNWIVTLAPNLLIFTIYLATIAVFAVPVLSLVYAILLWLWNVVTQLLIIIYLLIMEIALNPYLFPQPYDDGSITGNQALQDQRQEDAEARANAQNDDDADNLQNRVSLSSAVPSSTSHVDFMFPSLARQRKQQHQKKPDSSYFERPRNRDYRKKANGFDLRRVLNVFSFFKETVTGDKKRQ